MLGWVGVGLLMFAYCLFITKWSKWFTPINMVASSVLAVHAFMIHDIPFVIVNAFIALLLCKKLFEKKKE